MAVASQPGPGDFAAARAAGYAALINNRPDGEEPGQMGDPAERAAALSVGLAYAHVPVAMGAITEDDVARFRAAVAAADGPVLAHCKSGLRSLLLHVIASVRDGSLRPDEIAPLGARLGVDLSPAASWLAAHGAAHGG